MAGVGVPGAPDPFPGAMEELSIPELVSFLRSSFRKADFDCVERVLVEREESLAAALKSSSEALTLKEVEKIELEAKCEAVCKEVEAIRSRSGLLEERTKEAEEGFRVFSVEQEKKLREAMDGKVLLEERARRLALEKAAVDGEAERYRSMCRKLEEQVFTVEQEQKVPSLRERGARVEEMKKREKDSVEKIRELEVENGKLECARRKAEAEAMEWKKKYGELEALSLRLVEGNLNLKANCLGTSPKVDCKKESNVPCKPNRADQVCEDLKSRQSPKIEGEDPDGSVRIGPPAQPIIEIIDSDDEVEIKDSGYMKQNVEGTLGGRGDAGARKFSSELHLDLENDGATSADGTSCRDNVIPTPTPKRKRISRVVASDSESLGDEHRTPWEEVKRSRVNETEGSLSSPRNCSPASSSNADGNQELVTPSRRRLVPLSQCGRGKDRRKAISPRASDPAVLSSAGRGNGIARDKGSAFRKLHYPVTEDVIDHETRGEEDVESVESDSEGESLGGFIVNELNSSDNEVSSDVALEKLEVSSDSSIDQIFARIRREKRGEKWEYEADMLASFGKDPVICMKAVCALYRQQTADEQSVKGTLFVNNRGFNKHDARRGSSIAEFLTGGNPESPLKKSVKDLQEHDPKAVEYCYKLATHYSKQLFTIYQSREDPYFLPT